jgi:tRNA(fMet)-specific endonuclease VapC
VWIVWPFDEKAAWTFGRVLADLRSRGRIMQTVDVQIAAIALSLGNTTGVSSDSDLAAVPGLRVENWASA